MNSCDSLLAGVGHIVPVLFKHAKQLTKSMGG